MAPRPFTFTLNPTEVAAMNTPLSGSGGHQSLAQELQRQLAATGNIIQMDDALLGKVLRYMSQYNSGGFQARLHSVFQRAMKVEFGL